MVAIKDFPMPKNCFECLLYEEDLKFCIVGSQGCVNRYGYDPNKKPSWCPLIEIIWCKDCMFWNEGNCYCEDIAVRGLEYYVGDIYTEENDFCKHGRRE